MQKSVSEFEIKSLNDDKRELEGWASTPKPDRVGDVINPLGLTFQQEAPLLLNHKSDQPVGTVTFGQPTTKGLPFKAKIPKVSTPGVVKDRTDEAWDSVKAGLIKGVSIGFIPRESSGLSSGGTYFSKAEVHELSLTAVPCNPDATITTFKGTDFAQQPTQTKLNQDKDMNNMQDMTTANKNLFIRTAIAKTIAQPGGEVGFSETRWGSQSAPARYLKATVGGMTAGPDATGALTAGTLSRQQFVQAVFSKSILGRLQGLMRVPAITRINVETAPLAAAFFGEATPCPVAQGSFGVQMSDKRAIGIISVMSEELLKATDDAAESLVSGMLQRALSRGLDDAFLGNDPRSAISPPGMGTVATQATGFDAGIEAFSGDLTAATVILNPLTAVSLRSPTETQITANGGVYGGLIALTSYAVPTGKLFIVDGSRVLAYIGDAEVQPYSQGLIYGLAGASPTVAVSLFQTSQVALAAGQYTDWAFADDAAVEVTLAA